jgi:hypothetical protein
MKNSSSLLRVVLTVFAASLCLGSSAVAQTSSAKPNTLEERVAQSKATLKLQLSAAQSQKISQKCVAAQTLIKKVAAKDKTSADKRQQIYTDLSTQLTADIRTLQSQNVDVTTLKIAQAQFNVAINRYINDTATYETTVDDAIAVNCASDPLGFQSLLTSARQFRTALASDAAQIKDAKDTLAQTLILVAKQLSNTQAQANQ